MSERETVLVTGASSGIGLELARLFAAEGSDLVIVARREERLRALADELSRRHRVAVCVQALDLARPDAPERLAERLTADGLTIDVLVNNAGFGARGSVAAIESRRQVEMIAVNVAALTGLTGLLLPPMLERDRGGILNVASTAAFQPGPMMAVYYATKAFVMSFSEALSEEVRGTRVRVTCLAPGPTISEFQRVAGMDDALLFRLGAMSAQAVARAGHRGFCRGRRLVIPGLINKTTALVTPLLPRGVVLRIVRGLQERRGVR